MKKLKTYKQLFENSDDVFSDFNYDRNCRFYLHVYSNKLPYERYIGLSEEDFSADFYDDYLKYGFESDMHVFLNLKIYEQLTKDIKLHWVKDTDSTDKIFGENFIKIITTLGNIRMRLFSSFVEHIEHYILEILEIDFIVKKNLQHPENIKEEKIKDFNL